VEAHSKAEIEANGEIVVFSILKPSACAERVGRSAAAKSFDETAIDLAVKAHVRHAHSENDRLLSRGWERSEARREVSDRVAEIMERWRRD
jgi:hypothetical protein